MPDPIRPGHVSFDISFKKTAPPTPVDEDAPLRMAILGHFSGRADAAGSRPLRVDCDNFDSVCAQFAASLHLPACAGGTAEIDLAFKHLDDFHPDQLLKSVPALATLSDLRARLLHPGSTEAAVAELRGLTAKSDFAINTRGPPPPRRFLPFPQPAVLIGVTQGKIRPNRRLSISPLISLFWSLWAVSSSN
jgi:type VI secretion system ImpB/VipA family protein